MIIIYHFYQKQDGLKVQNFVGNLHNKTEYVIHMRNLKQVITPEFVLRKFIELLILYIDMNPDLRKKAKN